MEPEISLPHSQQLATCPYFEQDRSTPRSPYHFSEIYFNIIFSLPLGSHPSGFPTKLCMHIYYPPYVLHAPTIWVKYNIFYD
jgi:hypothetical protein